MKENIIQKYIKDMKEKLKFYQELEIEFNKLSFSAKILFLSTSKHLILGSDYNWFEVLIRDIEDRLEYGLELNFDIPNEWDSSEIHTLLGLLDVDVTYL